jgi:translation initiation factor IF-2
VPARIYSLAKDLDIDSKDLVEICRKAGIPGKGSALASLTDDEVVKVRAYLAAGDKKKAEAAGESSRAAGTPVRPGELAAYTRQDYIALGPVGKIKVLDASRKAPEKEKPQEPAVEPAKPTEPVKPARPRIPTPAIKLAAIPDVQQPAPAAASDELKAQKPEIRLPKDAIVSRKAGQKTPLEHLARPPAEKKPERTPSRTKPEKRPPAETVVPIEAPLSGKGGGKRRRGGEGEEEGIDRGMAGMAAARADRQKSRKTRARGRVGGEAEGDEGAETVAPLRRPKTLVRRHGASTAAPRKEKVALELPCTVRSFSEVSGISSVQLLRKLMELGMTALNINTQIDDEMAQLLAGELGVDVEFKAPPTLEEQVIEKITHQEDTPESLQSRPPVVTFLGHVDHGKTSLLDRIIGTDVVSGEAGGITQHIRAYQIEKDGRKIAFVDTPGHEAFTEMRARGANVTDIAVLVVAADDGVMPQTEEAISHAKAANVPIVVALNKSDLPGANPARALQQLAALGLLPSEWGGDVEVIKTSAITGEGIDALLETILVTAELHDYRANANRAGLGVCLEAQQEADRGVIAKLMVKNGTLNVGDVIVCGSAYGRVKSLQDTLDRHRRVTAAGPSTPVNVTGLDQAPEAGEKFFVLNDIAQAREIASQRATITRQKSLAGVSTKISFEEFQRRLAAGKLVDTAEAVTVNLIIRTDVRGSIEAIEKELGKLEHPEVKVHVLHKSVGAITAADVMLAHASQAVIVGFNVIPDEAARALAEEKQVEIRRYDIIYKVTDDIKAMLEGRLKPEERVVELGHALVKRVFTISRVGAVAGCYVVRGQIARGCRIRVNREGRTIGDYALESLRREKDDVKEVPRGMECGMKLAGFDDVKQDDVLEAYRIEEVARTL